jgi:hypothetical protein
VWQVIQTVKTAGNSVEDAATYLELPVEKVHACVRYFADYPEEIDSWAARAALISQREEAMWQRQREALGWVLCQVFLGGDGGGQWVGDPAHVRRGRAQLREGAGKILGLLRVDHALHGQDMLLNQRA